MTTMPRISVVTVTFNACEFIEDCISSILATNQSGLNLEVLVVDNGSTDGTVELLRERYPQLKIIQNDENNYARALNLGIANSEGEFVVISNNDATVHGEWLQGFLEVFREDKKIERCRARFTLPRIN